MSTVACGIDFGTSNTSAAIADNGKVSLVPVEGSSVTIPSAIFFRQGEARPHFGREAIKIFFDREEGRFMRSLKRVLGTSLMKQGTLVNGRPMRFDQIISSFLKNVKSNIDSCAGKELDKVVMGRPVHFIDNDSEGDVRAQNELKSIAQQIGFRHIEFQFEPIAAAFAHEVNITGEKLAIVADLGGGTSDFTVIRLSNQFINKTNRASDILANTGVRVGGNDFDKDLSLSAVMPEIGYQSTYGEKNLEVPPKPFSDLAEWSKVNFLYTTKILSQTREILFQAHDKKRYSRLLKVLERELGHTILSKTEQTKIDLTRSDTSNPYFDFVESEMQIYVTRSQFEEAIVDRVQKISDSAKECIKLAGVKAVDIELVILTGGSTEIPVIQSLFRKQFPSGAIADENKLSSVGLGLAYDAMNRFK